MSSATETPYFSSSKSIGTDLFRYPNLRIHREQRGLSQAKLAAQAEVGKDLISSAERNNPHRRLKLLAVIHALNQHERTQSYGVIDPERELITA